MTEITQIKFHFTNEKEYCQLTEIQNLRNDLIHLKTQQSINRTSYEELFTKLLQTETDRLVDSAFIFMNAIQPQYLVEETSENNNEH